MSPTSPYLSNTGRRSSGVVRNDKLSTFKLVIPPMSGGPLRLIFTCIFSKQTIPGRCLLLKFNDTMPPFVYTCASSFTHAQRVTLYVTRNADIEGYVVASFAVNKSQRLFSRQEEICRIRNYYRGNSRTSKSLFFHISIRNQQKPEHCPYTAQNGDTLLVHYVVCDNI